MHTTARFLLSTLAATALALSACQQSTQPQAALPDKLTDIQEKGTLVVAIDPAYPPQSEIVPDAARAPGTKCAAGQFTAAELRGFDVDVAVEIAKRLGVEACFVTPGWTRIVRGGWSDQWDISVGSMTVTPERMETLSFTQPYYTTPAAFFVHSDNTIYTEPGDLSGRKIGVCSGCTYLSYLEGTLDLPGQAIHFTVTDAVIVEFTSETQAIQELAYGDGVRLDAALIASPTGKRAISNGLPVRQLGDPVYSEYAAAAVDKQQEKNPKPLVNAVTAIIQLMHTDGTLQMLSNKYYGEDLTAPAAEFDGTLLK